MTHDPYVENGQGQTKYSSVLYVKQLDPVNTQTLREMENTLVIHFVQCICIILIDKMEKNESKREKRSPSERNVYGDGLISMTTEAV